ncbi:MAG: hypothetical protein WBD34_10210 [Burkholderiaceae bacterium]
MPLFSTRLRSTPLFAGIVAATFTVLLSACGGSDSGPEATAPVTDARFETVGVSLTQSGVASDGAFTKAPGDNLIDLNTAWPTWAGADSGITFDAQTGQLLIPGDGSDVVLGVRRFDTALSDGVSYTLNVQSSDPQSAAVLFLFDTNGTIVPVPSAEGLATARDGQAITITAPAGVAGFYLQVQNRYQASVASLISAELIEGASTGGGGDNLIDAQGPWLDWAGNTTGINGDGGNVTIPASANGTSLVHGIKRFSTSLIANTEYELAALTGSGPDAAVLLFLLDASGQIISFSGNAGSTPWLTAISTSALRFRAPEGVASFVVQVQGPINASGFTGVLPSLVAVSDEVEPPVACSNPEVTFTVEDDFEPTGPVISDLPVQISTDGRFETFQETSRKPTDPDVVFWYTFLRDNTTGVVELIDATETGGNRRGIVNPQMSANGRYLFYIRMEDRSGTTGETSAVLYRYDVQRGTRFAMPETRGGQLWRVSADGQIVTLSQGPGFNTFPGTRIVRFSEECS